MMTQSANVSKNSEDLLTFFQQYAFELLKQQDHEVREALRRRHINTDNLPSLEDSFRISCKLSSLIPSDSIKEQILQQINEIVYFLKDFQINLLGQFTHLFHIYEVEILIENNIKQAFHFECGKLTIHISYLKLKFFNNRLSCQDIKKLWNHGKQFNKTSPIYKYWWLLNPIGEFRSNLREMLLFSISNKIIEIDKLLIHYGYAEYGECQNQWLNHKLDDISNAKFDRTDLQNCKAIITFLKDTVNEEKLGYNLEEILKGKDESTLVRLLVLFKNELTEPSKIEEIISTGILVLQEMIQEEESNVDIKMFGFVNVGNYHRIDVALSLSSGYLKNYIEVIPRKTVINAILLGFINIYTIDDITVKPNFHGALHLNFETIALEQALKELQLLP